MILFYVFMEKLPGNSTIPDTTPYNDNERMEQLQSYR